MKLSARNQIAGTIKEIRKGATTAHVEIDIGGGAIITASITNEAVEISSSRRASKAYAVIKASDVMIGVEHAG